MSDDKPRFPVRRLLYFSPLPLLAVGAAAVGFAARVPDDRIAPGVHVADLDLGGKTLDEAKTALEQWSDKLATERRLLLRMPPQAKIKAVWKPTAKDVGLGVNVADTLADAAKAGREGIVGQVSGWLSGPKSVYAPPRPAVREDVLRAYLTRVAHKVNRPARNARFLELRGGGFGSVADKPGLKLDLEASAAAVTKSWTDALNAPPPAPTEGAATGGAEKAAPPTNPSAPDEPKPAPQTDAAPEPLEVTLETKIAPARITKADVAKIDGLLGSFSTRYGGTGGNRAGNIALAAGHINKTLLLPGEIFSYNKTVGPRIESAGFKDAPVIIKGELVPGVGGGICQVSSTLYNAVLLSGLKIVSRSHHAFPVHYLPAGRDATVVDGAIDFKFQNDSPAPIYIAASALRGRLSFRVYGEKEPGREVAIQLAPHGTTPAGMETLRDPTLRAGRRRVKDKGHIGRRVTVYRIFKKNGATVRKEVVSNDRYRPFPAIVLVGTKPVAAKPKSPVAPQVKPMVSPNPAPAAPQTPR